MKVKISIKTHGSDYFLRNFHIIYSVFDLLSMHCYVYLLHSLYVLLALLWAHCYLSSCILTLIARIFILISRIPVIHIPSYSSYFHPHFPIPLFSFSESRFQLFNLLVIILQKNTYFLKTCKIDTWVVGTSN